jgi:hypothetical protein
LPSASTARSRGAPGVEVADGRLAKLGIDPIYGSATPFAFMALQDVQELSNFFERRRLGRPGRHQRHRLLRRRLLSHGECCLALVVG